VQRGRGRTGEQRRLRRGRGALRRVRVRAVGGSARSVPQFGRPIALVAFHRARRDILLHRMERGSGGGGGSRRQRLADHGGLMLDSD